MNSKREKEWLENPHVRNAVRSFIPKQVYERVIRNPDQLDRVGERRVVTVLFVDIAGFTPLCEGLDAEAVMLLLNDMFKSILGAVTRFGGSIDKFMGDAAIVLFGAPVAHENDPQRALGASLEIMRAIEKFSENVSLEVSIGINTGEVVAGLVGDQQHREYTVIGDAVNVASRLQGKAEPGEILVGEETYKSTLDFFEFGPEKLLQVKGKNGKIRARNLISSRKAKSTRFNIPLIGKKKALEKLISGLQSPIRKQILAGEAGTGKSLVFKEFGRLADKRGYRVIDIVPFPWGINVPFQPVQNIVEGILGEKPLEKLVELIPKKRDFYPLISAILPIEFDNNDRTRFLSLSEKKAELIGMIGELIIAAYAKKPLLFLIDNSQNLDSSTRELIDWFESTGKAMIYYSTRQLPEKESHAVILKNLNRRQTAHLIRSSCNASRVGSGFADVIFKETEGNPQYIVELVSLLKQRNELITRRGILQLKGGASLDLPHSIDGIYRAKIDALPPDAREIVRLASVMGLEFHVELIEDIMGTKIANRGIDELIELGLAFRREDQFRIISANMLRAAYLSILQSSLKKMHLQAAGVILAHFADDPIQYYEQLARHFEIGENLQKAFIYNLLSAQKQEKRYANREALHYYKKVIEVGDAKAIDWNVWKKLFIALESAGKLYWYMGELNRVVEVNQRACKLAERMNNASLESDSINRMALAYQEMGDFKTAEKLYERVLVILSHIQGERERVLQAMANLGTLLSDLGRLEDARELYMDGLELLDDDQKSAGAANLFGNLGWLESQFGHAEKALKYFEKASLIDSNLKNIRGQAINSVNMAQVYRASDDKKREIKYYENALELFQKIGDRRGIALCLSNLGDTARETGEIKKAESFHRKARKMARELEDPLRIVDSELGLAIDMRHRGKLDLAIKGALKALDISRKVGDWEGEIEVGLELLKMYIEANRESEFSKLKTELHSTIRQNNPSAIQRLEQLNFNKSEKE